MTILLVLALWVVVGAFFDLTTRGWWPDHLAPTTFLLLWLFLCGPWSIVASLVERHEPR